MTTQHTTTDNDDVRLPRRWFRAVLREYRAETSGIWICGSSEAFRHVWEAPTTNRYLRKLAQRFCDNHKYDFHVGHVLLFSAAVPLDAHRAVRTAFLRWCIASTANRTA